MKKLIYATLMIAMFFASGTIFNSKNSLKAEQSEIQALNPFKSFVSADRSQT
jgi:ABC-type polysaccharide/polyol phosphate export permease